MSKVKRQEIIYSDLRGDLEPHPATEDIMLYTNEEAVVQSIRNLLTTEKGERPFQPQIGNKLRTLLFEPLDPQTTRSMKQMIKQTIDNFEPRCTVQSVQIVDAPDQNAVMVSIVLGLLNRSTPITFQTILTRTR